MWLLIFGFFFSLATSLFLFRGLYYGNIFGELFDTRLMIVLHEHWYRFFLGKDSFLNAGFFYPYDRSFALSDTFLLTGPTHAFFRVIGLEIINAWLLSNIIWVTIGLFGWFLLSTKFLSNRILIFSIVPIIATAHPFLAHFNERPNVIGYLLSSWTLFFLFNAYQTQNEKHMTLNIGLALISIPLIVLTSWYAGFFLIVFLAVVLMILALSDRDLLRKFAEKRRLVSTRILFPFLILAAFLTSLWGAIYLPEFASTVKDSRSLDEVVSGSPKIETIFNDTALGGSRLHNFFKFSYQIGQEQQIGISPFFVVIFLIVFGIWLIIFSIKSLSSKYLMIRNIFISALIIEIVIFQFINGNSIFIFLFDNVSIFRTIRMPVRWHIYLMFVLIALLFFFIDRILERSQKKSKYILLLIPFILIFDQYREAPGLWQRDQFISQQLLNYKDKLNSCDAFILDRPRTGAWLDIIESLVLTVYVDKPSVLGYSGSKPKGYPSITWSSDGEIEKIIEWLKLFDTNSKICFLDGHNFKRILMLSPPRIDFFVGEGFTGSESKKSNSWAWAVLPKSYLYLQNFSNLKGPVNVNLVLEIPECLSEANIVLGTESLTKTLLVKNDKALKTSIPVLVEPWSRNQITLESKNGFCKIDEDPRELHYLVKNIVIDK